MEGSSSQSLEREKRLNELYLAIISRYKDYIEEKEGLSVAELPTLVMPANPKVVEKVTEIEAGFLNYNYDADFSEAAVKAYEFVKKDIAEAALPLQFWLTPDETLTFMMGDIMDKNILLCSMLIDLGNPSAKVFVRLEESVRKVFVYYEFDGKVCVMDTDEGMKEFNTKDEMLASLGMSEETTAYEFNNQMYVDIF
ncbi:MAG: hypothetical protein ABSA33_01465 [Candidatus Micrarchaeaceae archaeon]